MVTTEAHAPATAGHLTLAIVAVAPLLALFVLSVIAALGWMIGARPFWPVVPVTLSEASGIRDNGEVVRLIEREGVDPNRPWPVREGILGDATTVTPLEAATMIGRLVTFQLLVRHGATLPDGPARDALICRAVAAGAGDVLPFLLKTGDGSDPRDRCTARSSQ